MCCRIPGSSEGKAEEEGRKAYNSLFGPKELQNWSSEGGGNGDR